MLFFEASLRSDGFFAIVIQSGIRTEKIKMAGGRKLEVYSKE
jgi:hypothetical protein